MIGRIAAAGLLGAILSAPALAQDSAAAEVEPEAYLGLWYEIARTPTPFQQQCGGGVTAIYERTGEDGLRVLNRCDLPEGGVSSIEGTAEPANEDFSRLRIAFPDSPGEDGEYVVEAVGPVEDGRHSWAAVTAGDGEIGWILSRAPELDEDARRQAEEALEAAGIGLGSLEDTEQPPSNYAPERP